MIKITGGPVASNMKISVINADGSETELTDITKIEFEPIKFGELLTCKLTFIVKEMDVKAEVVG